MIITNPPWEVFQTDAKEFFKDYSNLITKKKMSILQFVDKLNELLNDHETRQAWLQFCSKFPHQNAFFKKAPHYRHQVSVIKGMTVPGKTNLFKVFTEQSYNLLGNGFCGIIVPASIYTDADKKQLREMLFSKTEVGILFGLSNEKFIFEGVHHAQKFCLLTFKKRGSTSTFTAAFRINPREAVRPDRLKSFLHDDSEHVHIPLSLIKKTSPDSLSVMEFKNATDLRIMQKISTFPLIGEDLTRTWNLKFTTEFDKTATRDLFRLKPSNKSIPVFEGGMIHHFNHRYGAPQYYIDADKGKERLRGKLGNQDSDFACTHYRLVHRRVTAQGNERTLICTIIPPNNFCDNSVNYAIPATASNAEMIFACAILCSFVFDFQVRGRINSNVTIGLINQLSLPRLSNADPKFTPICVRASRLICTTAEFDDLAKEVGLKSFSEGATDLTERARLRAELDGMIAHLYGLTEEEFTHILSTFPLVEQSVKDAALDAYREFAPKPGDQEIVALITKGESSTLEFKSSARWDFKQNKQNKGMEDVIVKTVAAMLNTEGGNLLIGVDDERKVIGLEYDYKLFGKPDKRDAYENFLTTLLLGNFGKDTSPLISITIHELEGKDVAKVAAKPSPKPVFVKDDKAEHLYIRAGNSTRLLSTKEALDYCRIRWPN